MKEKIIYALGFFDGVHLGHQALLAECVALAQQENAQPGAVTFLQHPQTLFTDQPPALINTDADRDRLMRQYGIETIRKLPATREVMSTPWQEFLLDLLAENAAGFVCGEDYRFGHRGEGNAQRLQDFCKERGLPCVVVPDQLLDGIRVSSTHIRGLLEQGQMTEAVRFLGHPHLLTGSVVSGRGLGHTMGIPTANLVLPADLVQPKLGVYACTATADGKTYPAVTNIGFRPTVGGHHVTIEPWLLDFAGDLYGKEISLSFHHFLRPEQKFSSLVKLQAEIRKNGEETRKILGK